MKTGRVLCLSFLATLLGCGGGGGGFSTGVPSDKKVGDLDQGEFQQICAAVQDWARSQLDRNRKRSCLLSAVSLSKIGSMTDAEAKAKCKKQHDDCLNRLAVRDARQPDGGAPGGSTATCPKPPATCTVTVGEYETCLNETAKAIDDQYAMVPTCDAVTLTSPPPKISGLVTPESCKRVSETCGTTRMSVMTSSTPQ